MASISCSGFVESCFAGDAGGSSSHHHQQAVSQHATNPYVGPHPPPYLPPSSVSLFEYARRRQGRRRASTGAGGSGGGAIANDATSKPRKRRNSTNSPRMVQVRHLSGREEKQLVARFGPKLLQSIPRGYHLVKILGEGAFGTAVLVGRSLFDTLVYKLQVVEDDREFEHEVDMQRRFAAVDLAPRVLDVQTWNHKGQRIAAIVMAKVDGILDSFLSRAQPRTALNQIIQWIIEAIQRMCKAKLTHGDMHAGNIAYVIDLPDGNDEEDEAEFVPVEVDQADDEDEFKATAPRVRQNEPRAVRLVLRLQLIDFGWASHHGCFPELELIQALRTFSRKHQDMPISTQDYLQDNLQALFVSNYDKHLRKSQSAYETKWKHLMDEQKKIVYDEVDVEPAGQRKRRRRRSSGRARGGR